RRGRRTPGKGATFQMELPTRAELAISVGALRLQLGTVKILGRPTDGPEPLSSAMEFASIIGLTVVHVVATSPSPAHFHFSALRRCWAREMPRLCALAYSNRAFPTFANAFLRAPRGQHVWIIGLGQRKSDGSVCIIISSSEQLTRPA